MSKVIDKTRHHITVHGREESGQKAAYMQDGQYFDGEGNEIAGMRATVAGGAKRAKEAPAGDQVSAQLADVAG